MPKTKLAPARVRGVQAVRADAAPAPQNASEFAVFAERLGRQFEEFQAKVASENADAVTRDEVAALNTSIGEISASLDAYNTRLTGVEMNGGAPTVVHDERLDPEYCSLFASWFRRGRGEEEVVAQQSRGPRADIDGASDADGGYLAPIEWDRTITRRLRDESPLRQICQTVTTDGRGYTKLYDLDGATASWVGEKAARNETATPTLGAVEFHVHELAAQPAATQRMLDDGEIDVENWLSTAVTETFVDAENDAFVNGDGNLKPIGILSHVTGGAHASYHPWGDIKQVNSGAAAALTVDGVIDLVYALDTTYRRNARFAMNSASQAAVRKLRDGEGNLIWQPGLVAGQPSSLMGYPISELAELPDIEANAEPIIFGDFQRGYLIVDRIGIRVMRDPYTSKPKVLFYTTKRVGGGVNDPRAFRVQTITAGT